MSVIRKIGVYDESISCNMRMPKKTLFSSISGFGATLLTYAAKTPLINLMVTRMAREANIDTLSKLEIEDEPTEFPIVVGDMNNMHGQEINLNALIVEKKNWPYATIHDYHVAYIKKTTTPSEIAGKLILICESEKVKYTNAIVEIRKEEMLKAAEESTKRYEEGKHLSVVDGVPFFVKEHISIENYTTYYGVSGLAELSTKTAFCIEKLLEKGALLVGTTTMPQVGSNPVGFNPSTVFPSPRNPWNTDRYTGGSSSGNGVVVGMGLCPFSIGSDALGSIRVPSGFCGIVGLRSTYSRVSNKRATSSDHSPFLVIGPMSCCVGDAAIIHAIISGPDEEFPRGINQPCHLSPVFENYHLGSKKFGICREYISNADDYSIICFNEVCDKLRSVGSQILDIPIPELLEASAASCAGLMRAMHESIISDESNIILSQTRDISLKLLSELGARLSENDLMNVQKQRTRSMNILKNIFESVDFILLLNTCAPPPEINSSHKNGLLDVVVLTGTAFFAPLSSLTGVPALCLNIGYQKETGLPISIQILSKWWTEDALLSVGNALENLFPLNRKPSIYESPLDLPQQP